MSNPRNLKRALIGLTLVAAQVVALPMVGAQSPVHAAAAMTVVKSADQPSGVPLDVGDTITYTVTVANAGDEVLTGLTIDDVVPPGATYVPGSSRISGVSRYLQYRDEFPTQDDLDNCDGETDWSATPWNLIGSNIEIKDGVLKLKTNSEQEGGRCPGSLRWGNIDRFVRLPPQGRRHCRVLRHVQPDRWCGWSRPSSQATRWTTASPPSASRFRLPSRWLVRRSGSGQT